MLATMRVYLHINHDDREDLFDTLGVADQNWSGVFCGSLKGERIGATWKAPPSCLLRIDWLASDVWIGVSARVAR